MFRPNHDIVSCLDHLALGQANGVLLDDLFDYGLGGSGSGVVGDGG